MITFPKSTEYGKMLPKTKLFEQAEISGKIRQALTDDVIKITITNKLAATTLNIDAGKTFPEIMVLKIALKKRAFNERILNAIDKSIRAAFVLFVLEFGDEQKLSIAYKDKTNDKITLAKRWTTGWVSDFELALDGRGIDAVYEGFIRQISDGKLLKSADKSLKEKVATAISSEKIERQIERLKTKMKNEPQLKKKLEIKSQIKKLKEQL